MRNLIVTLEYPPQIGGIASYIFNFARHPDPKDFAIYAPEYKGDKEFDAKNPWQVYRFSPYCKVVWPHWLRMLFQVRKIVKKEKVEQLLVHQALPVGYVGYILKKLLKIKYIVFLHGTDLEYATKNRGKMKKFKKVCMAAEKVVVNSEFLKNKLLDRVEGLSADKIVSLHPCPAEFFLERVDLEKINKLKNQLALSGKKVMITVGRLVEGKGFPHVVNLLPAILKEVPNLVWLVVGDGAKKKEIIEMIQKKSLQNVVRFFGEVPYNELPTYFQLADLFVMLTHADDDITESWGTVFLEASASGLPVVAGRSGGTEETVENTVSGLVVDVYQKEATARAIIEFLKNPDFARKMGEAGRERVKNEFTWEKQISKLGI